MNKLKEYIIKLIQEYTGTGASGEMLLMVMTYLLKEFVLTMKLMKWNFTQTKMFMEETEDIILEICIHEIILIDIKCLCLN